MSRIAYGLISVCLLTSATIGEVTAQPREIPVLNSVGRFLGYGYTQGGYHSQTGRPWIIRQRHPATNYQSRNLQYAYHPSYQPARTQTMPYPLPQPSYAPGYQQPAVQAPTPAPTPQEPTAPKEPPPEWLKQYLKNKAGAAIVPQPGSTLQEPEMLETPSPSDRDLLTNPRADLLDDPRENLLDAPTNELLPPGDELLDPTDDLLNSEEDLLDSGDDLLDGDDDDLLLLENGISAKRRTSSKPRIVPISSKRSVPTVNRYRFP